MVEAQGKRDPNKPGAWAYYLSYLYAKYQCQPVLLVLCQESATARWAATLIELGLPGWSTLTVRPLVLGPDNVPVIEDAEEAAQDVPLAVFSAITHGKRVAGILKALAAALDTVDPDTAAIFAEFTEAGLGDTQAREIWRDLMTTLSHFYRSEAAQQVRAEGREEGRAEAEAASVLRTLKWRGIEVPDAVRERVVSCADLNLLSAWAERAYEVAGAEELFTDVL
ncbi:MAG TPA: hypothetical protein VIS29_23190 [Streptomyces sp.]